ncbi:MAG: hypothetical protein LBN95_00965 [Prevotellaceae bacterium]|jgi:hypothetical protein|nr:hypothetical protein [Prevotellaceae bacterium]
MSDTSIRNQIWALLNDTKFNGFCLESLVEKYQKWERNINIFLAIASCGSIAAWAVWEIYPMIWALIIAVSQVITAVKPYFPYFKYVKEFNAKKLQIDSFNIELEKLWYKFENDRISEDEAAEIYFEIKTETAKTMNFSDDIVFKVTKEIEINADEKMKLFSKNNYHINIEISINQ